jgi:hypothetical protein
MICTGVLLDLTSTQPRDKFEEREVNKDPNRPLPLPKEETV